MRKALSELKVGDRLAIVIERKSVDPTLVRAVKKVTKEHIITEPEIPSQGSLRFDLSTGEAVRHYRDRDGCLREKNYYRIIGVMVNETDYKPLPVGAEDSAEAVA